ncbi:hypothetical protein [Providencia rettgeri]|uniref:Uncharacterized protein n=1 Tax=Providencia rettgeri TaxID=587 RepID=A0AAE2ZDD2_PRORE|nr:hypothetical protein [Providencia rettgeri]MBW3115898.1 hypothetical protein [Providencia rettgeri]
MNKSANNWYEDNIKFLSSVSVPPNEVRLLSAGELYEVCGVFQRATRNHIERRWLPSKDCRNALAHHLRTMFPNEWIEHAKWTELIELGLESMIHGRNHPRISESEFWDSLEELETDLHLAIRATYKTILLFQSGDNRHLTVKTDVFVVPSRMNEFLASLVSGDIYPVWVAQVDSGLTPKVENGVYPQYTLRKE